MAITNATLAQQIADLVEARQNIDKQFQEWISGAVGGGVSSDGRYPLTDYFGVTRYTLSPAQLEDNVEGSVGAAAASAAAALASEQAAASSESAASTDEGLADAHRIAAISAQGLAETARDTSVNASINATASQVAAGLSETNAAASEVAAGLSEDAALASEIAAAASAAAAATFDPINFYLRTALDGGQLDNRYYTETEIDATFANYTLTSGLNIANWNTAFGWGDHSVENYAVTTGDTFTGLLNADAGVLADDASLPKIQAGDGVSNASWVNYAGFYGNRAVMYLQNSNAAGSLYIQTDGSFNFRSVAGVNRMVLNNSGNLIVTGTVTGSNLNVSNWDTAHGWGDHASGGYQSALTFNQSGNWWGAHIPAVSSAGVVELGKYIDWHETDAGVTDYDYRMTLASGVMTFSGALTVQGTMAATTVTGANVTSGANPGHTHTGSSISALDAGDTTTGVFTAGRLGSTQSTATVRDNIMQYNRWGANYDMDTVLTPGIYGGYSTMTNGPAGMNYDPFLVMGSSSDVRTQLVAPRLINKPLAWRGLASGVPGAWHYSGWTTTQADADLSIYAKTSSLGVYAPLASPSFTGVVTIAQDIATPAYLDIKRTAAGVGGLRFYNSANQLQGYVYHDGSQTFGLLHSGGGWAMQIAPGSTTVTFPGNVNANGGLDVSGNITVTGTVDGVDLANVLVDGDIGSVVQAWDADLDTIASLGLHASNGDAAPGADKILRSNTNGYTYLGWINTVSGATTTDPVRIYASQDAFIRYMTPANFIDFLEGEDWNFSTEVRFNTLPPQSRYGMIGRYSDEASTAWGGTIWSMDTAYKGGISGANSANTSVYGVRWLRASHANAATSIGEGLHVYQNGVLNTGMGTAGIYSNGGLRVNGVATFNGTIVGDGATTISAIETITMDSTGDITKASHGNYLYHQSTSYNADQAGGITFSTSAPSGGVNGDIWFEYT